MPSLEFVKATIERAVKEMVTLDSFHLTRMTKYEAIARVIERLQQEMTDAVYFSPERMDKMAQEARTLALALKGVPGPVIQELLFEIVPQWLPSRSE